MLTINLSTTSISFLYKVLNDNVLVSTQKYLFSFLLGFLIFKEKQFWNSIALSLTNFSELVTLVAGGLSSSFLHAVVSMWFSGGFLFKHVFESSHLKSYNLSFSTINLTD